MSRKHATNSKIALLNFKFWLRPCPHLKNPTFFNCQNIHERQRAYSDGGVVGLAWFQDQAPQGIHRLVQF